MSNIKMPIPTIETYTEREIEDDDPDYYDI